MRVKSRIVLVVISLFLVTGLSAQFGPADCPLSLADSTPAGTSFDLSPHGVFRSGSLVYVLRGQVLTTYAPNDVGNLAIVREDPLPTMAARETEGGVAFANNMLYVSSEAGLEIYDLTNTRAGGSAPRFVHRAAGYHYRRIAVSGSRLAGLFPATDMPCYPTGSSACVTTIDILDVGTATNPFRVGAIVSYPFDTLRGFNDIAFNSGYLVAVGEETVTAFDISNPGAIRAVDQEPFPGKWLVSNGSTFLAVGNDNRIDVFTVRAGTLPFFERTKLIGIPGYVGLGRANEIRFNRNAYWDDATARLITMIEEVDAMTLKPARTIAFDVFDFTIAQIEGSAERIFEDVSFVAEDEVKHNPVAVGAYIYVVGETTGIQSYGSCGVAAGRIELESPRHLSCGGAQIYGWVTGQQKITSVELFLDNQVLGLATLGGPIRQNVSSSTPVTNWRANVNLDNTVRGEYQLRAVATNALGERKQFAMKRIFFEGPGSNCTNPRRRSVR
jgi:hypothetical protein